MLPAGVWTMSLLLIIPFIHSSAAVKCYVCNSRQEARCADPFKSTTGLELQDCTQDHQQRQNTRKAIEDVLNLMTRLGQIPSVASSSEQSILPAANESLPMACQKLDLIVLGEHVTGRGCSSKPMGYYNPCDAIKVITNKDITLKHCSLCDSDGCNSSERNRWTPLLAIALISLIRVAL